MNIGIRNPKQTEPLGAKVFYFFTFISAHINLCEYVGIIIPEMIVTNLCNHSYIGRTIVLSSFFYCMHFLLITSLKIVESNSMCNLTFDT